MCYFRWQGDRLSFGFLDSTSREHGLMTGSRLVSDRESWVGMSLRLARGPSMGVGWSAGNEALGWWLTSVLDDQPLPEELPSTPVLLLMGEEYIAGNGLWRMCEITVVIELTVTGLNSGSIWSLLGFFCSVAIFQFQREVTSGLGRAA